LVFISFALALSLSRVKVVLFAHQFSNTHTHTLTAVHTPTHTHTNTLQSSLQLESYPENGIRLLRLRNVQLAQSGELRLQVKHPVAERRTPAARSYTSLLVLPIGNHNNQSNNNKNNDLSLAATSFILKGPEDCTALIGGHVQLSVQFEPFPNTKVIWYKAVRT